MRVTISTTLLNHVLSLRFGRRSLTEYYLTRDVQHSETILNLAELLFLQANCGPGGVLQACSFRGRFPNRLGFNTRPGVFRSLQESSDLRDAPGAEHVPSLSGWCHLPSLDSQASGSQQQSTVTSAENFSRRGRWRSVLGSGRGKDFADVYTYMYMNMSE